MQAKATVWYLICSFMQRGISMITTPIFTRLLNTDEYGQYNVFNSWLGIVTIFVTLHLFSGVYTQGLVKFSEDRKRFSSSLYGLSTVLVLGWTLIYLVFRGFWNNLLDLTTVQMLAMLVMMWASTVFNFWAAEQRVELKFQKLVLLTLVVSLAKPIVGVLLVLHAEDRVTARILGIAVVEFALYTGLYIAKFRSGGNFYSGKYWKYALLFNLPLVPHYLSQTVLNSADRIMIKNMVGASEAGIYSLAYSISQIMALFNTALLQAVNPWIYQRIKDDRVDDIPRLGYPMLCLIGAVNLFLIGFAPEILTFFAPGSYHDAVWVIPPVAMSCYFMFAYALFADFEFYFEKTKHIATATSISAALNIILNYVCIRRFGYYAAGYTTLFCYFLYTLFHYLFMKHICGQYLGNSDIFDGRLVLGITGAFMAAAALLLASYTNIYVRYAIMCAGLLAVFIMRKKLAGFIRRLMTIRDSTGSPSGAEMRKDMR